MPDDLDIHQVAKALGVQRGTIDRWRQRYANTPEPVRKVGNAYLWRLSDWQVWLSQPRIKKQED